ncbi:hypothetical protein [Dactylosporangium sp. CA-139066]|uniref:hypothetical protein n=1 Tax=Dactylosporangium sp. CA-139066 TaxID=3239930 RepID=UPI003D911198
MFRRMRIQRLQRALTLRVRRWLAGDDVDAVLDERALSEAARLMLLLDARDGGVAIRGMYTIGMVHLARFVEAPPGAGDEDRQQALELFTIVREFWHGLPDDILRLPFALLERRDDAEADELGPALLRHAIDVGDVRILSKSIRLLDAALARHPDGDAGATLHESLCVAFQTRAAMLHDVGDARQAIRHGTIAADRASDPRWQGRARSSLAGAYKTAFELGGDLEDLDRCIDVVRLAAHDDVKVGVNLGMALRIRYDHAGREADLVETIEVFRDLYRRVPREHEHWARIADGYLAALFRRGDDDETGPEFDEMLAVLREIVAGTAADDPDRPDWSARLAIMLTQRLFVAPIASDLAEAIRMIDDAVAAIGAYDPRQDDYRKIRDVLWQMLERATVDPPSGAGEPVRVMHGEDAEHAVSDILAEAKALLDGQPDAGAVDRAVQLCRDAVAAAEATPDGSTRRLTARGELVAALLERYLLAERLDDLHELIALARDVAATARADAAIRVAMLPALSQGLVLLYERTGAAEHLDAAVDAARAGAAVVVDDQLIRDGAVVNAISVLRTRIMARDAPADLDEAIELCAAAPDHPDVPAYLAELLSARFGRTRAYADVDGACRAAATAVGAKPDAHRHGLLSEALAHRYSFTADLADLDQAVDNAERGLALAAGDPDRTRLLCAASDARRRRFEARGVTADLDGAIDAARRAVRTLPGDATAVFTLAGAVFTAAQRPAASRADVDESVELCRQLVTVAPGEDRAAARQALAAALRNRHERAGAVADLREATTLARAAADESPRPEMLSTLAGCLYSEYRLSGTVRDLDAAMVAARRALEHPEVTGVSRLALVKNLALLRQATGAPREMRAAMRSWREIATSPLASDTDRIEAAMAWGDLAERHGSPRRANEAFATALDLLPRAAWRAGGDRERVLADHSAVASLAAAHTAGDGRPGRAVEQLEHGRAVMWSQRLQLRRDLIAIWRVRPDLAARMEEAQAGLADA